MIYYLRYALRSKWVFLKPPKKDILIYDGLPKIDYFLDKNNITYFNKRNSVNIFILFKTLIQDGFKNIKENYIKNYFNLVSPKIVMTSIDNNLSFFKLKYIYNEPKYICIQGSLRDKFFLEQCRKYYKKNKKKLFADYFFVYGKNDLIKLKKYISTKFIINGSFRNNLFSKKIKKTNIKEMIFISQASNKFFFDQEKTLVYKLIKISKKLNLKFLYLLKNEKNSQFLNHIKNYFKKLNVEGQLKYFIRDTKKLSNKSISYKKKKDQYNLLNKPAIFLSLSSTFAFEAISRKQKVIFFPINSFPTEKYILSEKYKKNGPFWLSNRSSAKIEAKIKKVISMTDIELSKSIKKNISDIIVFSPKNKNLETTLKKLKVYS